MADAMDRSDVAGRALEPAEVPAVDEVDEVDALRLNAAFASTFNRSAIAEVLRGARVHPDDLVTLLRWAPLGLTHMCWRNSVLEDWHAGPDSRISDAEMMRATIDTTRLVHQALWDAFGEWLAGASLVATDDLDVDAATGIEPLALAFENVLGLAFAAERELPHGQILGDLAAGEFGELIGHAEAQLGALLAQAEVHGAGLVVAWLAARGRLACPDWWGSPRWPYVVDAFLARLGDPADEFWSVVGAGYPAQRPSEVADLGRLRATLLSAPDALSSETVEWLIDAAGIGFVQVDD